MKLDLDDLRGFVAIAELSSFHAAADLLNLSQPALTRRLQKLEAMLGVQLIDRNSRQLRLSTVGREFFFKAKRLLDELDAAVLGIRELADQVSGEVTIGAVPTATYYFLPRVIEDFNASTQGSASASWIYQPIDVLRAVQHGQAEFGLNLLGGARAGYRLRATVARSVPVCLSSMIMPLPAWSRYAGRILRLTGSSRSADLAATG